MRTRKKTLRKKRAEVLESVIESKVTRYALSMGCLSIKLTPFGTNGWPDRLYLTPNGDHFYIEFKRKGEQPTTLQEYIIRKLRGFGVRVAVIDSYEAGVAMVDELLSGIIRGDV